MGPSLAAERQGSGLTISSKNERFKPRMKISNENGSFDVQRKFFASQERVSGVPEKGADLRGSPGNFRGSLGNFRGSLGDFRGTSGLLLSSTVRELLGKSPKNFRGSLGNFRGSPGSFQKLGVA